MRPISNDDDDAFHDDQHGDDGDDDDDQHDMVIYLIYLCQLPQFYQMLSEKLNVMWVIKDSDDNDKAILQSDDDSMII